MPNSAVELTQACRELLEGPAEQLWVLFLRSQGSRSKEAALMALEFEVVAAHCEVRPYCYKEVAPGLVVLASCADSPEFSFLKRASELTALRRPPVRLCQPRSFASASELAAAICEVPALQKCSSWWLDVLLREPQVDASLLPLKHCHGADLALQVVALAGKDRCRLKHESGLGHTRLVAFQANGAAFLLGHEAPDLPSAAPASCPCLPPSWHQMWSSRSFKFSAGLDSQVASAVISIAFWECRRRAKSTCALTLLDACCGSGTLAAVAAASGRFAAVIASDVDPTFASRARENFAMTNLEAKIRVVVHDATVCFKGVVQSPDVVVANPPWGWRIGSGSAIASQITCNLLREFPDAVVAMICPELPPERAILEAKFELRWSCTLGQSAVWILVPTPPPEKVRRPNVLEGLVDGVTYEVSLQLSVAWEGFSEGSLTGFLDTHSHICRNPCREYRDLQVLLFFRCPSEVKQNVAELCAERTC